MKKLYFQTLLLLFLFTLPSISLGQIAAWNMYALPGGTNNFGPSPYAVTNSATNVIIGGLSRGSGVGTSGTGGAKGWGGTGWNNSTAESGITARCFATFTIKAKAGYVVSLSTFDLNYKRSSTGATSLTVQYQINTGAFVDIAAGIAITTAGKISQIDLSSIAALQNVNSANTITFRIIPYGASASGGTWYIYNSGNSASTTDLNIGGSVSVGVSPVVSSSSSNLSGFIQNNTTSPSSEQSLTVSASNLTADVSATATSGYEVSLTSGSGFSSSVNLSQSGGTLTGQPVTLYVRQSNLSSLGTNSGTLTLKSAGATDAVVNLSGIRTQYFYSASAGNMDAVATWWSNPDGASGTNPIDFTTGGQVFLIQNRSDATLGAAWSIADNSTGSKIIIGDGTNSCNFTIPSGSPVTGTIDISNNAILTLQDNAVPTFGNITSGTINFAQSGAFTIPINTYKNLTLEGGTKTFLGNTTTVVGDLVFSNTTLDAPAALPFATISLGGNLTYLGTVNNPADANSITLRTTGTGTQTITGNGNTARFFALQTTNSGNNVVLAGSTTNLLVGNASTSNAAGVSLTAGTTLTLNGNTLTYFKGNGTLGGTGTITCTPSSNIVFQKNGATAFGTLRLTSGSETLNNLTLDLSGTGSTVVLGTPVIVNGALAITNGTLKTLANTLTLGPSATITESTGKCVVGNLQTTRSIGSGVSSDFGGLGLTLGASAEDLGNVTLTRVTGSPVTLNSKNSISRIWKLNPANPLTVSRDMTVSWSSDDDNGLTLANVLTWQSTDDFTTTDNVAPLGAPGDASTTRSMSFALTSLTAGANTSYAIFQADSPLPVELNSFSSVVKNNTVNLSWTTATEKS
ncbi:MAG: hypothetical protein Q8903_12810, partial [Bacteroidota bacterium]|nr:hypothetical protein [Bacteroidota bacterium]